MVIFGFCGLARMGVANLDFKFLDEVLSTRVDVSCNDLIGILQEIQELYGYLPAEVLLELSRRTAIAASQIYGVVTFYEQFYLEPHGRHTIKCCRGTACHVKGGLKIINMIRRILGIEHGETTDDMEFTFETVACIGTCFLAPAMMVDDNYYGHLTAKKVENILESYR